MPRRILIVDDSKTLVKAISTDLEEAGYTVSIAFNAKEVIKKCQDTSFDLIIMDLNLAGINGLQLLSEIKRITKNEDAFFIVITAYGSLDTAIPAFRAGAHDYFIKPLNLDELRASVRRALGKKVAGSAAC